ncbi:ATP-binding protein [Roseovarius sp. TE539]|uniref:ATP-dependent DNA helicase n=1 Tax=Roseovarius sp. TE539 TaxID=2249812 RepID=UPI000DDFFBD2|nr:AAA family ATPase [Roseovarius sp. TE539]RBI68993.1 ATP-binding protein [Roseovarius sp. TE539]
MSHKFSSEQAKALYAVADWLKYDTEEDPIFRLFGYAGTGKTTLAKHIADGVEGDVHYAAFSGKAASVMQKNGCVGARTIHRLIYRPRTMPDGRVTHSLNPRSPAADAALIILDECSMVNADLARDLMSFGTPILVLGDPAQLPPVNGAGYFTETRPDVMLTKIHRQALESPILRLATEVRKGRMPEPGDHGACRVITIDECDMADIIAADQVLAGCNELVGELNRQIRRELGYTSDLPGLGDRLLCLKNNYDIDLFNGETVRVTSEPEYASSSEFVSMMVKRDSFEDAEDVEISVHRKFFTNEQNSLDWEVRRESHEFGYGYAMTVHKAQGSQWDNVLIFDESEVFRENAQAWLYTAITRASEKLTLVI